MKKRTQNQIELDYKRIKKAAATATSFKEIQERTGLSYPEVISSLKKHPIAYERIRKQLGGRQASKSKVEKVDVKEKLIVIDASICSTPNIESIIMGEESKIVLTSVTVKELSLMQSFNDGDAMRARHLLLMAAENDEKFEHKLINENLETADACILDFCIKNKHNVTLYTADKEMYNFAKIYSVPAKFFKTPSGENKKNGVTEFGPLKRIGEDLIIDLDHANLGKKLVRVFSNNQQFDEGIIKVNIGDEILFAAEKRDFASFAHYKVISLWANENCNLIFSKRVYDLEKLNFNYRYKTFLRDFKRKIA